MREERTTHREKMQADRYIDGCREAEPEMPEKGTHGNRSVDRGKEMGNQRHIQSQSQTDKYTEIETKNAT